MISRAGRSPLGAFARSPLGVRMVGAESFAFGIVREVPAWILDPRRVDVYTSKTWEGTPTESDVELEYFGAVTVGELVAVSWEGSGGSRVWTGAKLWDHEELWARADDAWIGLAPGGGGDGFVCSIADIREQFGSTSIYPYSYSCGCLAYGILREADAVCWPPNEHAAYHQHEVAGVAASESSVVALVKSVVRIDFDESGVLDPPMGSNIEDWWPTVEYAVRAEVFLRIDGALPGTFPYVIDFYMDATGSGGSETLTVPGVDLPGPYVLTTGFGIPPPHTLTNILWAGGTFHGALHSSTVLGSTFKTAVTVSPGVYAGIDDSYFFEGRTLALPYGSVSKSIAYSIDGLDSCDANFMDDGVPKSFNCFPVIPSLTPAQRTCNTTFFQAPGTGYIVRTKTGIGVITLG